MFVMSTDSDVVTSIMDFIPEIIWHGGIKDIPLRRIYGILMDCFSFSGPSPVVIPKLRDVAYLSARAYVHIKLQRRCITQYEEHEPDNFEALCSESPLLSPTDYGVDSDLETVLFMVDMIRGHDDGIPWEQIEMTSPHHEWMSHVFLYRAWAEKELSEVVMDFVEDSMSLRPPSDIVTTDCLFIIGLMIGVPFHVSDITVRDKRLGLFPPPCLPSAESSHLAGRRTPPSGKFSESFQQSSPLDLYKLHRPFAQFNLSRGSQSRRSPTPVTSSSKRLWLLRV